jgi:hypothetical protein
MTFVDTTTIKVGAIVLYQAPGTSRSECVLAKVTRTPTHSSPLYELDLGESKIECSWFSIRLLHEEKNYAKGLGVFGKRS